jgi:Asp-tRNAAsn/Glu-tRNAGln amidotransferase A subunit and related amidases
VFDENHLAALVYPTVPLAAPLIRDGGTVLHNGRRLGLFPLSVRNSSPGSVAGVPSISLPCGCTAEGVLVGLSLEAAASADLALLAVATSVEVALSQNG